MATIEMSERYDIEHTHSYLTPWLMLLRRYLSRCLTVIVSCHAFRISHAAIKWWCLPPRRYFNNPFSDEIYKFLKHLSLPRLGLMHAYAMIWSYARGFGKCVWCFISTSLISPFFKPAAENQEQRQKKKKKRFLWLNHKTSEFFIIFYCRFWNSVFFSLPLHVLVRHSRHQKLKF